MNLFEDLVEELKESNLLEETVIDSKNKKESNEQWADSVSFEEQHEPKQEFAVNNKSQTELSTEISNSEESVINIAQQFDTNDYLKNSESPKLDESINIEIQSETNIKSEAEFKSEQIVDAEILAAEAFLRSRDQEQKNFSESIKDEESKSESQQKEENENSEITQPISEKPVVTKNIVSDQEFFKQRAVEEVNCLQMVELVFSGVEREQMKTSSEPFNDLEVKQALHDFVQITEDVKSNQHTQSEFRLMQETENWFSALTLRDRNISVGHLRRYCETTKPSLSSQALISLARFYRNSPFSETVRGKYDLVITKLLTKEVAMSMRELLFSPDELLQHIQELYADWSSVPLYSTDDDDSSLLLAALKFQDFSNEAQLAETFDELIKKDFFKRLKVFKEQTSENFFSPILVSAAIECNVIVGNRYVELLEKEKEKSNISELTNRYGIIHDKSISEATGKTLELLEILKQKKPEPEVVQEEPADNEEEKLPKATKEKVKAKRIENNSFKANKWLIMATFAAVLFAFFYFLMGNSKDANQEVVSNSKDIVAVNLENSSLKEYVQSAKISRVTLFAITKDSWKNLNLAQKEDIVRKFLNTGQDKGFEKVHFIDGEGKTVAFGSKDNIKVME